MQTMVLGVGCTGIQGPVLALNFPLYFLWTLVKARAKLERAEVLTAKEKSSKHIKDVKQSL